MATIPAPTTPTTSTTTVSSTPLSGTGDPQRPAPVIRTLIDQFLEEQATTTAVQRFAQRHADATGHLQARWYADLMPASPPGPGQQYAFEVDLDACSGCKACVTACGALNGLEPGEGWRAVGSLVGVAERPVTQAVTTACHHCVDPGCLAGCPVDAYEKDPVTGIVRHLDDQCIGCRYCTLTCPYEVPTYSADLGIVRKCDLCHDRLGEGEAPACVQSCPTQAIAIRVVDVEDFAAGRAFPFASPDAATTAPTTLFRTSRDLRTDVEPADLRAVRRGHAHLPLTVMLVLTQVAVGGFAVLAALDGAGRLGDRAHALGGLASMIIAVVAMLASVAHLGRPHLAWRAVIGLRHSWLSREIVAFGAFAGIGVAAAAEQAGLVELPVPALHTVASGVGLVGVLCSAFVYVATGRRLWRAVRTIPRFLATTVAGGGAVASVAIAANLRPQDAGGALAWAAGAALVGTLVGVAMDLATLRHAGRGPDDALARTATLLRGALRGVVQARLALALAGMGLLAVAGRLAGNGPSVPAVVFASLSLLAVTGGELTERWWFFTAEADLRMPGARR